MNVEGGFSLQPLSEGTSSDLERRRGSSGESSPEAEISYWLNEIVNPEKVQKARQYPLCAGWSTERHILEFLLGKIVERSQDLDPAAKTRLRNLIGVFRVLAFPNMTEKEQEFLKGLSQATTVDFKSLEFEATPEVQEDLRWIWTRFGLEVPASPHATTLLIPPQE